MFRKLCKKLVLLLSLILVATTCFGCFGNPSGGKTPDGVAISVTGVKLNKERINLPVSEQFTLTETVLPSNATNKKVTWSSSNSNIAYISNGVVVGLNEGMAVVYVTTEDGKYVEDCIVNVVRESSNVAVTGVTLDKVTATLTVGGQLPLTHTILPLNATNKIVTWSSSDNSVATVNSGTVNAVKAGTATITVTTADGNKTASCTVTVTETSGGNVAVTGVMLNKSMTTLTVGESETLVATVQPANASNKGVTWSSLQPSIATVNNGVVTALASGTAIIAATTVDGRYIADCIVTINPASLPEGESVAVTGVTLNKTTLTLEVGNIETLIATVLPSNATNKALSWSTDNNCISIVNGTITAVAEGEATIVVITADGNKTASCDVTVVGNGEGGGDTPDDPVDIPVTGVTLSQETLSMVVDDNVRLTATVLPSNATNRKVDWSSNSACVEVVAGVLIAHSAGEAVITVTTRDGNFTATCTVTVEEAPEEGGGDGSNPGVVADDPIENSQKYLATVDNVGREIKVGKEKADDYYVGIFYHLWHGDFSDDPAAQGPNSAMPSLDYKNIQQLLDIGNNKINPDSSVTGLQMLYGTSGQGQFYYWNEPLYGYYSSMDRWVLTRHVELFTTAGLDYLCIDTTNPFRNNKDGTFEARLFKKPVETLLSILLEMQDQGFDVPKLMFYTNTGSADTVQALYDEYYTNPAFAKYESVWFAPNGKPLIVGITEKNAGGTDQTSNDPASDFYRRTITQDEHWELLEYFEIKDSKWPSTSSNPSSQYNAMPWMSWDYPQAVFSPSKNLTRDGYAAIPVAQHGHSGYSTSVSSQPPMGHRGYNLETRSVVGDWKEGLQYQMWWDKIHTRTNQIKTVMVTGWNEWIAQKQAPSNEYKNKPAGNTVGTHFVDVFNNEYSRDIEMMKAEGGYGDNYYLQTMHNLRRLKREDITNPNFPSFTLDINSNDLATLWTDMGTTYKDFEGDAIARAHWDASGSTYYYEDNSNRNDIVNIKVTHDDNYYYFYVDTASNITAHNGTDTNWMNLFIGTEYGANTFAGFNYVLNREPNVANGTTSIHRYNNGTWESVGTADINVQGNMMMLRIPRSLVGRTADTEIRFKVSDNVQEQNDIMDYYVTGDSAPIGRLGFVYGC